MAKYSPNALCPCGSTQKYKKCCAKYHKGAFAPNALTLMKSRYSAFATQQSDHIVKTTHPLNSDYTEDIATWKASIALFCEHTNFLGLEIISVEEGEKESYVHFIAKLSSGDLNEKSHFLFEEGQWLYVDGIFK